ncbi:hypothetical protein ACFQ51_43655 [Streptomyces kaempferi]
MSDHPGVSAGERRSGLVRRLAPGLAVLVATADRGYAATCWQE